MSRETTAHQGLAWQRWVRVVAATAVIVLSSGCITYSGFPRDTSPSLPGSLTEPFRYAVDGSSVFNGHLGIREVLQHESPFADPEELAGDAPVPPNGWFIRATITNLPPGLPAAAWAYVAGAGLLFLAPAVSTQDGYRVKYEAYRDGQRLYRESYEFRRKTAAWLPIVLIAWVNLLTPSEKDAFEATARQFLTEAMPRDVGIAVSYPKGPPRPADALATL